MHSKYVLNCRREVEIKQDGMLMVTVWRTEGNGGGDGDANGGSCRRVVQFLNVERY